MLFVVLLGARGGPASDDPAHQPPPPGEINRLIHQLGSPKFAEREAATRKLDEIGEAALDALERAADDANPERRRRAEVLVRRIEGRWELPACRGHRGVVTGLTFSPDGRQLLSESVDLKAGVSSTILIVDGSLRLWDLATGEQLIVFDKAGERGTGAFTPDGGQVVSRYWTTARLWEVATGRELRRFGGGPGEAFGVAISPDGRQVLAGDPENAAQLWDLATAEELCRLEDHEDTVTLVRIMPDGRRALSATHGNTGTEIRLWDLTTGRPLRFNRPSLNRVLSMALSPDGRFLLLGGDECLCLWDLDTDEEIRRLEGHAGWVYQAGFYSDGLRAFSAAFDSTVRVWDLESGKQMRRFGWPRDWEPVDPVWGRLPSREDPHFSVSADGRLAASAGQDGTIRIWRLPNVGENR